MIKSLSTLVLTAAFGLSLSACGSSNDAAPAEETKAPVSAPKVTPIAKPTPTVDTSKSVRGNLLMSVGDIGTISDSGTKAVKTKFTVNSIDPIVCDQPYSRATENGQLVAVDMTVETTPELANDSYPNYRLSSHDFKFIADNGTTFTGDLGTVATYSCLDDTVQFPSGGMGPAEKLNAKIVLDLPAAHGILVIKSGYSGGFEYTF